MRNNRNAESGNPEGNAQAKSWYMVGVARMHNVGERRKIDWSAARSRRGKADDWRRGVLVVIAVVI